MEYLDEIRISKGTESGIDIEVRLGENWKEAASKFPIERVDQIFSAHKDLARLLGLDVNFRTSPEYGLMGIDFSPDRAGLDLMPGQYSYLSHNIDNSKQAIVAVAVITDYLKILEAAS